MAKAGVRNAFIPPTALRMMRAAPSPRGRYDFELRSVGSGGESLGVETLEWGKAAFGLTINEFYGQTECNLVLGSCAALGVSRPGAIGKPVPGHEVAVIGARRPAAEAGEIGQIAVQAARSGDVPRILGQAGGDARKVHRRLDDDRRPGRRWTRTAISPSSAATTTSSPRPATASARARSRIA